MTSLAREVVVMLVWNGCEDDSRVMKEAAALATVGCDVTVVCLAAAHLPAIERRDGVTYKRVSEPLSRARGTVQRKVTSRAAGTSAGKVSRLRSVGVGLYRVATLRLAHRTFADAVRSLKPAVIHAHDLQTLPAAARLAREIGASLVYDTHELATEVSFLPPEPVRWVMKRAEGRAIKAADLVLTVSPGIAEHLRDLYGIPLPEVIYNSPPVRPGTGRTIRDDPAIPAGARVVAYVGALDANRGIEETLEALAFLPGFHLACVGPRSAPWEARLRALARVKGVDNRLHFLDRVPVEALTYYLSSADVGVVAIRDISLSYMYAMPNKLFELVLAGVPVVVSDLPHMRAFVEDQRVGRAADPTDPRALAAAIGEVVASEHLRPSGERLEQLRAEFGWDAQADRLVSMYTALSGSRADRPIRHG